MAGVNGWLIAVAAAGLAAQQTYRDRVDVPRVLVDVRVVDNAGKPVAGLDRMAVNRTGILGGPIQREDGAHGTTTQVFPGAA